MLRISKLADYATVVMHYLAKRPDERFSATVIAEQVGIGLPTVSKVLKLLNARELVLSVRGAQGGYQLSRPAREISLASIIQTIDGVPALTECSDSDNCCQYDRQCELRGNWQYINTLIYNALGQISLADMTTELSAANTSPIQFHPLQKIIRDQHA